MLIFIIKFWFLSKNFITDRLEFFADGIKNNYLKSGQTHKPATIEEKEIVDTNMKIEEEIEKEKSIDLQNSIKSVSQSSKPTAFGIYIKKIWTYIKAFFSTNLLAKLGWILVFLAVVYFLKGTAVYAWEVIWPVWRIIVGILIWFIIYFIWVKSHNKYPNEGLILMWTGILINFAVILSDPLITKFSFITNNC